VDKDWWYATPPTATTTALAIMSQDDDEFPDSLFLFSCGGLFFPVITVACGDRQWWWLL